MLQPRSNLHAVPAPFPAALSENKLLGEPQTISSCHVCTAARPLTWYDRAGHGAGQGLEDHSNSTVSVLFRTSVTDVPCAAPTTSPLTFINFSTYNTQSQQAHSWITSQTTLNQCWCVAGTGWGAHVDLITVNPKKLETRDEWLQEETELTSRIWM